MSRLNADLCQSKVEMSGFHMGNWGGGKAASRSQK
jgi:hypothetical protein